MILSEQLAPLFVCHSKCCQILIFGDVRNCAVENCVTVVLVAVCNHHHKGEPSKYTSGKIHRALVGDQSMNAAAEVSTGADQNGEDHGVGTDTDGEDDQTHCRNCNCGHRLTLWKRRRCWFYVG